MTLFEHLAEVTVFATGGFQVEDQVLDRETKVVERFLQVGHGLAKLLVTLLCFRGHLRELFTLRLGQRGNFAHELSQFRLEFRFVHCFQSPIRSEWIAERRSAYHNLLASRYAKWWICCLKQCKPRKNKHLR